MARHMTFHVGEFARMTGVNKRTLHYYDSEGIFSPDSVEPNGYRAYSSRQFYPFYMIRMFRDMGLEVPGDISVTGVNGVSFVRYLNPRLSTIRQDVAMLAKKSVDDLLLRISYGSPAVHEKIPYEYVDGESVASPRK